VSPHKLVVVDHSTDEKFEEYGQERQESAGPPGRHPFALAEPTTPAPPPPPPRSGANVHGGDNPRYEQASSANAYDPVLSTKQRLADGNLRNDANGYIIPLQPSANQEMDAATITGAAHDYAKYPRTVVSTRLSAPCAYEQVPHFDGRPSAVQTDYLSPSIAVPPRTSVREPSTPCDQPPPLRTEPTIGHDYAEIEASNPLQTERRAPFDI
jgi:hypothetical protein